MGHWVESLLTGGLNHGVLAECSSAPAGGDELRIYMETLTDGHGGRTNVVLSIPIRPVIDPAIFNSLTVGATTPIAIQGEVGRIGRVVSPPGYLTDGTFAASLGSMSRSSLLAEQIHLTEQQADAEAAKALTEAQLTLAQERATAKDMADNMSALLAEIIDTLKTFDEVQQALMAAIIRA